MYAMAVLQPGCLLVTYRGARLGCAAGYGGGRDVASLAQKYGASARDDGRC